MRAYKKIITIGLTCSV